MNEMDLSLLLPLEANVWSCLYWGLLWAVLVEVSETFGFEILDLNLDLATLG